MDPMEAKATTIQNWWRRFGICCGRAYRNYRCAECEFDKWIDFMEDYDPDQLKKDLQEIEKFEEEEKRKRQEKKRALGLIP